MPGLGIRFHNKNMDQAGRCAIHLYTGNPRHPEWPGIYNYRQRTGLHVQLFDTRVHKEIPLPSPRQPVFVCIHRERKIHLVTYGSTWSYDEGTDSWTKVSDNQFEKDYYYVPAIGFYYSGSPYVLEDGVELYKYLADYDRWVLCGYYPGCRGDNSYKTVFVIGDYAYVAATTSNYDGCAPLHFAYRDR